MSTQSALTNQAACDIKLRVTYSTLHYNHPTTWDWSALIGLHHASVRVISITDADINIGNLFAIRELHNLIFHNSPHAIRSVHPSDTPILRIHVIAVDVARRLAELDPDENIFHLEFFPASPIAELWSAQAWNESLTRRLRHSALKANDNSLASRTTALKSELAAAILTKLRVPREDATATALVCMSTPQMDSMLESLGISPSLINDIRSLRAEHSALDTNTGTEPAQPTS
jgi:hypothetical protein